MPPAFVVLLFTYLVLSIILIFFIAILKIQAEKLSLSSFQLG
jgi:hypothetical protein